MGLCMELDKYNLSVIQALGTNKLLSAMDTDKKMAMDIGNLKGMDSKEIDNKVLDMDIALQVQGLCMKVLDSILLLELDRNRMVADILLDANKLELYILDGRYC